MSEEQNCGDVGAGALTGQGLVQRSYLGKMNEAQRAEEEKRMRQQRIDTAIFTLNAASEIRADTALMAEIRTTIRGRRAQLGNLLDSIGD